MMERYLMYLRKSQMDRDFEHLSVEETLRRHKKALDEFCKANRINVTVVLEEVVSGESLSARPKMLEALELINTGEFAGIVCMDIDRISRGSSFDSGYIMQILQLNNCKIVTPAKTYDLSNDSDEQFADMKFMFSRYELKTITRRLNEGRKKSAEEGKFVGSVAPYGYIKHKLHGTKGYTLRIDPETSQVVKMIFDMYTEEGLGSKAIASRLNDLNIKAYFVEKWEYSVVEKILDNEVYMGKIVRGRKKQKKTFEDGKLVKRSHRAKTYDVYEGLHEAIISEEQFQRVQEIKKARYIPPVKIGNSLNNPFAGILRCEVCGRALTYETTSRPNTPPWYKCKNCGGAKCPSSKVHLVEQAIVEQMRVWFAEYKITVDPNAKQPAAIDYEGMLKAAEAEISELLKQQDNICDLLEKGAYSIEMFTKRNGKIEAELSRLRDSMKELKILMEAEKQKAQKKMDIVPITQHLLDSYEELTPIERNELWKQVVEKITYSKDKRGGEFTVKIYPKI